MSLNPAITAYGWNAVPRKMSTLLALSPTSDTPAKPLLLSSLSIPDTPLSQKVQAYAQSHLSAETFNHSMRVYHYGYAILTHAFPSWISPSVLETYFLTCMFHDIGTTDANISATLLSFEFYGGYIVLSVLKSLDAPIEQAENVAEAVIRHQDLGDTGTITRIGALVQLATIFDNMGGNKNLVAKETVEVVTRKYPRKSWSSCFAATIRKENSLKPWAHTTHLGEQEFPTGVENNEVMAPYDHLH